MHVSTYRSIHTITNTMGVKGLIHTSVTTGMEKADTTWAPDVPKRRITGKGHSYNGYSDSVNALGPMWELGVSGTRSATNCAWARRGVWCWDGHILWTRVDRDRAWGFDDVFQVRSPAPRTEMGSICCGIHVMCGRCVDNWMSFPKGL